MMPARTKPSAPTFRVRRSDTGEYEAIEAGPFAVAPGDKEKLLAFGFPSEAAGEIWLRAWLDDRKDAELVAKKRRQRREEDDE